MKPGPNRHDSGSQDIPRKRYQIVTRYVPPKIGFPWRLVITALIVGAIAFIVFSIVFPSR